MEGIVLLEVAGWLSFETCDVLKAGSEVTAHWSQGNDGTLVLMVECTTA